MGLENGDGGGGVVESVSMELPLRSPLGDPGLTGDDDFGVLYSLRGDDGRLGDGGLEGKAVPAALERFK